MSLFKEVAEENSENLLLERDRFLTAEAFLQDNNGIIPFHSCTLQDYSIDFDIDGFVIVLDGFKHILSLVHRIHLPMLNKHPLKNYYHILKKHFDLQKTSQNLRKSLTYCHGRVIGTLDGGPFLNIVGIPTDELTGNHFCNDLSATAAIKDKINEFVGGVSEALRSLAPCDMARQSVQKNSMHNLDSFDILPMDHLFVLNLLDQSLRKIGEGGAHKLVVVISQFGQKSPDTFQLSDFVAPIGVSSYSVHVACTVRSTHPDTHLLWSRCGLESVVGGRGRLFPTLGMRECVNYQTALDGHPFVLSPILASVFKTTSVHGTINFLQLYVDSPHTHISQPYKHPVSGAIVMCGLGYPNSQGLLHSRAFHYMEHMKDLALKFSKKLDLRIEQVAGFVQGEDMLQYFDPCDMFCEEALNKLFATHPMVIPFKDNCDGRGLVSVVKECLTFLNQTLSQEYAVSKDMGGFDPSWRTYQAELALEELIYGRPLSCSDVAISQSLGTSTTKPESATYTRGFMTLSPHSSATSEVSPPPLCNWVREKTQVSRVERVFEFTESLSASLPLVGEALVKLLLKDVYRRNSSIPFHVLRGPDPPPNLVMAMTTELFVENLLKKKSFRFPLTFSRARKLAEDKGVHVAEALKSGIQALGVKYFPSVKFFDLKRNLKINWNQKDYMELHSRDAIPSLACRLQIMVGDISTEIEKRSLSYSRNLDRYREQGMPWLSMCLHRLPQHLTTDQQLTVLTFLSCIGIMENGSYASFDKLQQLVTELPVSQAELQKAQVQSKFLLPKVWGVKIWRLHEDIPCRLPTRVPPQASASATAKHKREEESDDEPMEDVQRVEEEPDDQSEVQAGITNYMPACFRPRWSSQEIAYLTLDLSTTHREAYNAYVKEMLKANLPARTFRAFVKKRQEYLPKKN